MEGKKPRRLHKLPFGDGLHGPAVGQALDRLLDGVVDGTRENRREALLEAAEAWRNGEKEGAIGKNDEKPL